MYVLAAARTILTFHHIPYSIEYAETVFPLSYPNLPRHQLPSVKLPLLPSSS